MKLEELIESTKQFSLDNFITGRANYKYGGWGKFELSQEDRERAADIFAHVYGNRKTISEMKDAILSTDWTCKIYERLWIVERNGELKAYYAAAQDYPYEIRFLASQLRKHA